MRDGLKILGVSVLGAVVYGEAQDHSLIRYCPDYFTRMHPDVFGTEDLTLLALGWGFLATWWVGLILGGVLWASARSGEWPRMRWRQVLPGVVLLFIATGVATASTFLVARAVGFLAPAELLVSVEDLSADGQRRASTMLAAYNASYLTAFLGGFALCAWTLGRRRKLARGAWG
jgi:hypothetical protein